MQGNNYGKNAFRPPFSSGAGLQNRGRGVNAKIRSLLPLILFLPLAPLSAAGADWLGSPHFDRDGVDMQVEGTVVANTGQGWESYYVAVQPSFQMETAHVSAFTGMQLASGTFDLTGSLTVWPWIWKLAKLGINARYNLNYYNDISLTHNVLLGAAVETRPLSWLGAKASVSAMAKNRSVFAIDQSVKYLPSFCQAFSVELDFYLPYEFMAYFSVASYERYRYMAAIAPSFTFGATKQLPQKFYAGLEAAFRYTDFFTASTFYDGCEIRISAGRKF